MRAKLLLDGAFIEGNFGRIASGTRNAQTAPAFGKILLVIHERTLPDTIDLEGRESMQTPEPQTEHLWLRKLLGEWTIESECSMGPGQPPTKSTGREVVRGLGNLWTIGEGSGETPDGGSCDSIMTLGYDPQSKRFVGTFIASMMTHLWRYEGALDPSGKILTLNTEGPSFAGDGTMAKYQDIIEFLTDDHRTLTAKRLGAEGVWEPMMTAHYRRKS